MGSVAIPCIRHFGLRTEIYLDPLQQKHSEVLRLEDEVYRITRNNAVPTPHTPLATRAAISCSQAEPSAGQPSVITGR
jgi:hypothetical protein